MDGSRFDELTQRLASIRLTRGSALRGLAVSAVTLTGIAKVADEASAGKKRRYCECTSPTDDCETKRAGRRARRQALQNQPCSYRGACRGTGNQNPCEEAGAPITVNLTLLGDTCTVGVDDCDGPESGLECVLVGTEGLCLPIDLGDICAEDADCSTGRCLDLVCAECLEVDICGDGPDAQCCVVEASCVDGFCVLPIDSL